jgi:hypothetical protein
MMSRNFHESYAGDKIKPPSERSTGLVFAVVAAIVAVLWRNSSVVPWVAVGIALGLAALSLHSPSLLRPFNVLWFRLGVTMHRIVNPVVMFALFAMVFVPMGAIMRMWRDPLRLRMKASASYWQERDNTNIGGSMKQQF